MVEFTVGLLIISLVGVAISGLACLSSGPIVAWLVILGYEAIETVGHYASACFSHFGAGPLKYDMKAAMRLNTNEIVKAVLSPLIN